MPGTRSRIVVLLSALALAASGCGGEDEERSPQDVPADAVALVGEEKVAKAELDALMKQAKQGYQAQKRKFPKPGTPEYESLRNQAIKHLVERKQFEQEAEEMGIEVTDEEVDKRLRNVINQVANSSRREFEKQLRQQGLTEAQVRDNIRLQILQEEIYNEVTGDVKVSDADVERYYEKNREQYTQPPSRVVRHIVVKSRARAENLHAQLQDGADFAALARRFSQDAGTKAQGGRYQAVKGRSAPEFDKAAFSLEKGELSKPVKSQLGWHVIQAVSAPTREKVTPLRGVREQIEQQLLQERRQDAITKWVEGVRKKWEPRVVYAVGYAPPKTETGATTGE